MKIKTYVAPTVAGAMELIRKDFGSDVLIISNQHVKEGVRLTVGVEEEISEHEIEEALFGPVDEQSLLRVKEALEAHRVPDILIERILLAAREYTDEADLTLLLSKALERVFKFYRLPPHTSKRAFMLVGASGSGKTIAVAKMAVRAKMAGKKIGVITTDMKRAGAVEQLSAFTKILEVDLVKIRKPELLKEAVEGLRTLSDMIVIDSPGINPFKASDIDFLMNLKGNIEGLEPILVMSAGADAFEAADMAEAFLPMGCKRLLPTRLDLARRFGSILYAAQTNSLGLCDAGTSPHVSQGLCPMDALSLAQMMLSKE